MRVLIVDDHKLFAEVLRSTLEGMGLTVLPPASTGEEGLATFRAESPDLVLLDLVLPDQDGLAVGRAMLRERPEARVVAVTARTDPRAEREAIRRGFRGFLTKNMPVARFVAAIRAILRGEVVVQAGRPERRARVGVGPENQHAAFLAERLTPREREILTLLAEGATGAAIAEQLSVSPHTVRTHIQSILSKLQVHSRLEAAAFAVRHGIVQVRTRRRRE